MRNSSSKGLSMSLNSKKTINIMTHIKEFNKNKNKIQKNIKKDTRV